MCSKQGLSFKRDAPPEESPGGIGSETIGGKTLITSSLSPCQRLGISFSPSAFARPVNSPSRVGASELCPLHQARPLTEPTASIAGMSPKGGPLIYLT